MHKRKTIGLWTNFEILNLNSQERKPTTVPALKTPTGGPNFSQIGLQWTLTNRTLTPLVSGRRENIFGRKKVPKGPIYGYKQVRDENVEFSGQK
ncbi:hypothetical protein Hanom_Chr17g01588751 [Helianthus anomalus]